MDLGYVVIGVVVGLIVWVARSMRTRWNGKRDPFRHNPLPGHRQEGSGDHGGSTD